MPSADQNSAQDRKQGFIVIYLKGENWTRKLPEEEADRLWAGHRAHLRKQIESGRYALAVALAECPRHRPCGVHLGEATSLVTGVIAMNAASAEEVWEIATGDPMVKSGQFNVEVHTGILPDLSALKPVSPPAPRE